MRRPPSRRIRTLAALGCAAALAVAPRPVAASPLPDETTRVSNAPSGAAGAAASSDPTISADGNVIAFVSAADDLVAGDTNHLSDVFVVDRAAGTIVRASVASDGAQANGASFGPVLSADGRHVAFQSDATNLDGDRNGAVVDVFVHDLATGATELVSVDAAGPAGPGGDGASESPSISADGRRIAFHSAATNLVAGDGNGSLDIFVRDRTLATTLLASVDALGAPADGTSLQPILSGDGNVVAFFTFATNFAGAPPQGLAAIYAKELASGVLERIDVDSLGQPHDGDEVELLPPSGISDDGTLVLFTSGEELEDDDENESFDVYLRDRAHGTTARVGLCASGAAPSAGARNGRLSGDGRFVAFHSDSADVVEDDGNGVTDLFLRDRLHDVTTRLSVASDDAEAHERSFTSFVSGNSLSADGRFAVFISFATDFAGADGNGALDVFLRERCDVDAAWSRYGAGFPGRNGAIPTLTPRSDPVRGKATAIDISNSSGIYTVAFLFAGLARDSLPTRLGGTLLVDPRLGFALGLTPYGESLPATLPDEGWACGLVVDLQVLVLDPWAASGVAFSDGLELQFGD